MIDHDRWHDLEKPTSEVIAENVSLTHQWVYRWLQVSWVFNSHVTNHLKSTKKRHLVSFDARADCPWNLIGHFSWLINYSLNTVLTRDLYTWPRDHPPWSWLNFRSGLFVLERLRRLGSIHIQFYLEHVETIFLDISLKRTLGRPCFHLLLKISVFV